MPKVGEMIKSSGKFLKKEDLEEFGGEVDVTIVGVKEMNVAMENQPEELKWVMKLRELEKLLTLNNTNLQLIEKALGTDDTDLWKGKTIRIYIEDNVTFGGKMVGGIRVRTRVPKPVAKTAVLEDEPVALTPRPTRKPPGKSEDFEDDIPF